MDQRSICLFIDKQWLPTSVIYENFVAILDPGAIAHSIVTGYVREVVWTPDKEAGQYQRFECC
jgi:hypothetical protein